MQVRLQSAKSIFRPLISMLSSPPGNLYGKNGLTVTSVTYPLTAKGTSDLFIIQMPFKFRGHAGVELLLPLWLPLQANTRKTTVIEQISQISFFTYNKINSSYWTYIYICPCNIVNQLKRRMVLADFYHLPQQYVNNY